MTRTTLDLARRKAFEIHLAIATMQKPSDVWKQVDALLQILSPLDPLFDTDTDTTVASPGRDIEGEILDILKIKRTLAKEFSTDRLQKILDTPREAIIEACERLRSEGLVVLRIGQQEKSFYTRTSQQRRNKTLAESVLEVMHL